MGKDGNFYGTTQNGGIPDNNGNTFGTVFQITSSGILATLYSFSGNDGSQPSGLMLGKDGNFYGTTRSGGITNTDGSSYGTAFRITSSGLFATIYLFNGNDGWQPIGKLTQGTDGNFYGVTRVGGNNTLGKIYRLTPSGQLTTFASTTNLSWSGVYLLPGVGALGSLMIQGNDGNFYGFTLTTLFQMTMSGTLTTLISLNVANGTQPFSLLQAADGNFYGVMRFGGTPDVNGLTHGTVFRLSVPSIPAIITQPTNQILQAGSIATFNVAAVAKSQLNYQWWSSKLPIFGATNATLTLNSVTAANDGSYSVVVSNPYGSVSITAASLAVLADGANGQPPRQRWL